MNEPTIRAENGLVDGAGRLTADGRRAVEEYYRRHPGGPLPVLKKAWPGLWAAADRQVRAGLYGRADWEQEAWFHACLGLRGFDPRRGGALGTVVLWRVRQATSRLVERHRRNGRDSQVSMDAPLMARSGGRSGGATIRDMLADGREACPRRSAEDRMDAAVCLARLPPSYRDVVRMHLMDGLTLAEVGAAVGVSRERVRQVVLAAERRLLGLPGDGRRKHPCRESNHRRVAGRGDPCGHCGVRKVTRARRLCCRCHMDPAVRERYPKAGGYHGRRRGDPVAVTCTAGGA